MPDKSTREQFCFIAGGKVKVVIFLLMVSAFLILLKFFGIIPSIDSNPFDKKQSTAPSIAVETSAINAEALKTMYKQEYYRMAIDFIYSAKLNYPDAKFSLGLFKETENKIPFLALQTGEDAYPVPETVYYYEAPTFYSVTPPQNGTGSTAMEHFYFVKNRNVMIYRYLGNSSGSIGTGEQIIYHNFKDGAFETETQNFEYDIGEIDINNSEAVSEMLISAQNAITQKMDEALVEYVGEAYELISYNDIAVLENQEDFIEKELNYDIM